MVIFLTVLIVSCYSVLATFRLRAKRYPREKLGRKEKRSPYILLYTALLLLCNITHLSGAAERLPFCLMLGLFLQSSVQRQVTLMTIVVGMTMSLYFLIAAFVNDIMLPDDFYFYGVILLLFLEVILHVWNFYVRVRLVRNVAKMGTVWESLTIQVDALYLIIKLGLSLAYITLNSQDSSLSGPSHMIFSVCLAACHVATALRSFNSSLFVIWTEHERRIVESVKLSHLESCGDSPGSEQMYEDLYERVLKCFESSKPYLNPYLSINDVVEYVYSNKLYISKTISQHTGRNFCQFVNYYRVMHAIEIFRENPKLRVVEMATRSGFNSTVSFTTAFRLFMGDKPSDWCKKERVKIEKHKKFVAQ